MHSQSVSDKCKLLIKLAIDEDKLNKVLGKLLDVIYDDYLNKLNDYNNDISKFEKQYQMTSENFNKKFNTGLLGDKMDFFEWSSLIELRKDILKKIKIMEKAKC